MGKIRRSIQRQIEDSLDNSAFTSHDFSITYGDDSQENEPLAHIKFIYRPDLFFSIYRENVNGSNVFKITESPGKFEEVEAHYRKLSDFHIVTREVAEWCREVREEIRSGDPIYSEIDQLRKLITDYINVGNDDSEFSIGDINELKNNFDELKKRVDQLEKDQVVTEQESNDLKETITQAADDLDFYPKETWIRVATNKISSVASSIGKTKEGRAILADGAKKLLGLE